jgi:hypothetical protein
MMVHEREVSMIAIWVPWTVCEPPHVVTHPNKLDELIVAFKWKGWDLNRDALVGYMRDGRIQLLSGSHRWEAARRTDNDVPVVIRSEAEVREAFGDLGRWNAIMTPIPAKLVDRN